MNGGAVIGQINAGAHALELRDMHEALWEDSLGHDAGAVHGRQHCAELSLHVGRESGVGEGLQVQRLA